MTFKSYQPGQTMLLPPSYEDVLGEGHDVLILRECLAELDTTTLEESYANAAGGRAAYHPVMLVSILIYAYMQGVFSSRKIAQQCRQDLAFMYLAGNTTPDFRTVARFRKEKGAQCAPLFAAVVTRAQELGLISFGTCSIDGTKIAASAGRDCTTTRAALEEQMRQCLADAAALDAEEDAEYGEGNEDDRDPELRTKAGRARRRAALRARQKVLARRVERIGTHTATERVNTTDPDARLMRLKRGGYAPAYNVQVIAENGILLSSSIFTNPADQATLIPSMRKLRDEHMMPKRLLADKGYSTEDNYVFCDTQGIDAYIPVYAEQVRREDYTYDRPNDTYRDRDGRLFHFKQCQKKRSAAIPHLEERAQRYRMLVYEHRDPSTNKKSYLSMQPAWQAHVRKQKEKLATARGKQYDKQRMHDVEGVFADIKKNIGFTTFSLRGLAGVTAEWILVALAHNLKKLRAVHAA